MKRSLCISVVIMLSLLAGCGLPAQNQSALLPGMSTDSTTNAIGVDHTAALPELVNLDYSNGSITVFSIQNGKPRVTKRFTPALGVAQGLAMDKSGLVYTTVTSSKEKNCSACVEIFASDGTLKKRLEAPILPGAPGPPSLTDVSVDRDRNVYVSDYGQQAVYFFPDAGSNGSAPTIVVQNSANAASVLATPNGANVVVSGGCGFASVRPYTREKSGQYRQGSCFGIGTIALIGGAVDDKLDVLTPVDGVPGLVSVSSPTRGRSFTTPDQGHASISGVALNGNASIAYVANHAKECVYAFARPAKGWLSHSRPKVLATYKGFRNLDIIAVRP